MTLAQFRLPDLGEGLEEGEVVRWLVGEGDAVELNQPIVEVETAKATVEIPSPHGGRVARLHADEGESVAVGAVLVTFEVDDVRGAVGPAPSSAATPAVRALAKHRGVDLSSVTGTGPDGRVSREDVERAAAGGASLGDVERVPLTPTRKAIAQNLTAAAAVPQVTTFRTVDCSALEAFRGDLGVSPLPVFVVALAATLAEHPALNASWDDDAILLNRTVHVGVATDTERGLVVPVLRNAGTAGISGVATEIARLAEAARAGTLSPGDLRGATITVSNTGSYGSEAGTPILSPGCAVTVALGVIRAQALVADDLIEARPACTLSLTFDHRVLDGATIGRALTDLISLLEDPDRLRGLPR
jgi:pyruvate/2-oxoglutarate dehydrogenase complex dihydrolipoamide acyltransferase (E2) component